MAKADSPQPEVTGSTPEIISLEGPLTSKFSSSFVSIPMGDEKKSFKTNNQNAKSLSQNITIQSIHIVF